MQVVHSGLPASFFAWLCFWSGDENSHLPSFVSVAYSSLLHLVRGTWSSVLLWLELRSTFWLWVVTGPSLSSIQARYSLLSCVSLRLAWLAVCRVLRLSFASVRSKVFVGRWFRRSGFWTSLASLTAALGLVSFWFSKGMSALDDVWGKSFFFLTSSLRQDVRMFLVPRSFGFWSLHAYAEDLGVFLLLSVLCILSLCTCSTLPRWCLGPLCVRASSVALLAISRNAVSYFLRVVFCEGSASPQSVLAVHFLSGVSDHSVFVPSRLHFWRISRNAVSHVEGCFL